VLHPLLIAGHAACAIAAFILGLLVIWDVPPKMTGPLRAYVAALPLMLLFLLLAVAADWPGLDTSTRFIFSGLLVLGFYTLFRGEQAAREVQRSTVVDRLHIDVDVDDVGFTLIALFDGFVSVSAFDLGAPIWLVLGVGALGIVSGIAGVHRLKARSMNRAPVLPD